MIDNIVINARHAMPSGGTLEIAAKNRMIKPREYPGLEKGRYIEIALRDSGIGISEEHLPKIFDPYFSTKDTYNQKGLGLGLAVCYSVIRKHDGLITVESEVGNGTTYYIYLPAAG